MVTLDVQSCELEGSEPSIMGMGDVQRSLNASDAEWMPSRYVGRDPGPRDGEGFTDSSCALIRREVARTYYNLSKARKVASSCEELLTTIEDGEKYVRLKFIHHLDGSDPMHHVITHWFKAVARSMRITVVYFHASRSKNRLHCHFFEELQDRYVWCRPRWKASAPAYLSLPQTLPRLPQLPRGAGAKRDLGDHEPLAVGFPVAGAAPSHCRSPIGPRPTTRPPRHRASLGANGRRLPAV